MAHSRILERLPLKEAKHGHTSGSGFGARAILFNDDVHSFDEVARQLVKAIRCSFAQGMALANKVHRQGSAIVYSGHLERCEAVAMVLEQIGLRVKVET